MLLMLMVAYVSFAGYILVHDVGNRGRILFSM